VGHVIKGVGKVVGGIIGAVGKLAGGILGGIGKLAGSLLGGPIGGGLLGGLAGFALGGPLGALYGGMLGTSMASNACQYNQMDPSQAAQAMYMQQLIMLGQQSAMLSQSGGFCASTCGAPPCGAPSLQLRLSIVAGNQMRYGF